jgi:trehalose/maltose hydrolase-like predicted phosphorylase
MSTTRVSTTTPTPTGWPHGSLTGPASWSEIAAGLDRGLDPETGLIEQHRGFHQLREIDLAAHASGSTTMDVILGWERLEQLKLIKQADVVMLLALLGEDYPRAVHEANFRYYEPLAVHDSSLSPPMHALVAARLGDLAMAERYLERAISLDLDLEHGTTAAGGVHIATLGGIWQALVLGFGGMTVAEGKPRFTPHVPESWGLLRFRVHWRQAILEVTTTGTTATVTAVPSTARA